MGGGDGNAPPLRGAIGGGAAFIWEAVGGGGGAFAIPPPAMPGKGLLEGPGGGGGPPAPPNGLDMTLGPCPAAAKGFCAGWAPPPKGLICGVMPVGKRSPAVRYQWSLSNLQANQAMYATLRIIMQVKT